MKPSDYLNLTKKGAQDKAERQNLIFRLIRVDAETFFSFPSESDKRDDRVCIEIDKGVVTKVTFH